MFTQVDDPVAGSPALPALVAARKLGASRLSWVAIFAKAYALVAERNTHLRRNWLSFPWGRIYEHPVSECAVLVEREWQGEEAVLAAKHAIVTVEEIVDELVARPRATVLPNWVLDAVCHVPNGAWPAYAADYSVPDNAFYEEWDGISRDRERFTQWMQDNVLNATAPVPSEVAAR